MQFAGADELFATFRETDALAKMNQLPSVPDIVFGAFNADAQDELDELASLFSAARDAGAAFRMVSLGAAPGDWPLRAERAYLGTHPKGDFRAWSIEGDFDHFRMIEEFLSINNAKRSCHELRYGVIAEKDGHAYFPIINPVIDWGAGIAALSENAEALDGNIVISDADRADRVAANGGKDLEFRTVKAYSLDTLLGEVGTVDYLHSDIQGAELSVFPAGMDAMNAHVKMACIATHSRHLEGVLLETFARHNWHLLAGHACGTFGEGHDQRTIKDGVFIWRNPRLAK